jgi:exodeoxyribonuclease VII large subunit
MKDRTAALSAVMFESFADGLTFAPDDGVKVIAFGRVSLYEKTGKYQLYVTHMEPAGVGALYASFMALKAKLEKEGLFDAARKRPIPDYCETVAVVTSPTGAVARDIIRIARERNKGVKIALAPVVVQGDAAGESVANAIRLVNEWAKADVIIVGRGGGSIEDLWAFNEEIVARAIFASKTPVVSAVGHETDVTIADFAADLRAPTPSAAAEIVTRGKDERVRALEESISALDYAIDVYLGRKRQEIAAFETAKKNAASRVEREKRKLAAKMDSLRQLSPLNTLRRGFAAVYSEKGAALSASEFQAGSALKARFKDGIVKARAYDVEVFEHGEQAENI